MSNEVKLNVSKFSVGKIKSRLAMETCFIYLFFFWAMWIWAKHTIALDLNSLPHKLIPGCHFQIFVLDNQCTPPRGYRLDTKTQLATWIIEHWFRSMSFFTEIDTYQWSPHQASTKWITEGASYLSNLLTLFLQGVLICGFILVGNNH